MITVAVASVSGKKSGIGHLRRTGRLAKALRRRNGVSVAHLDLDQDPCSDVLVDALSSSVADLVLIDVPPALRDDSLISVLSGLRERSKRVVAIDGPAHGVDLLVVPSFYIDAELRSRRDAGLIDLRWGWDHLLIDQRHGVAPRSPRAPLLVLSGGSDAAGLGRWLPDVLDTRLERDTAVTWVVGPRAPDPSLPLTPRLTWEVLREVSDLRPIMQRSRLGLSVYGVSTLELLHHGIPTVTFSPNGTQDLVELKLLENEVLALTATDATAGLERLLQLVNDSDLAETLAQNGASRIPRSGTEIVADAVLSLVTES